MNILLIGLNHCHQLMGHTKASKKFKLYLNDVCLKEQPKVTRLRKAIGKIGKGSGWTNCRTTVE